MHAGARRCTHPGTLPTEIGQKELPDDESLRWRGFHDLAHVPQAWPWPQECGEDRIWHELKEGFELVAVFLMTVISYLTGLSLSGDHSNTSPQTLAMVSLQDFMLRFACASDLP